MLLGLSGLLSPGIIITVNTTQTRGLGTWAVSAPMGSHFNFYFSDD